MQSAESAWTLYARTAVKAAHRATAKEEFAISALAVGDAGRRDAAAVTQSKGIKVGVIEGPEEPSHSGQRSPVRDRRLLHPAGPIRHAQCAAVAGQIVATAGSASASFFFPDHTVCGARFARW
jgi:hypothetical protein